jgi:cytochrome c6
MSARALIVAGATWIAMAFSGSALAQGAAPDAATLSLGKQLFITGAAPACAICHTLKDAGAEGTVGPVLDELKPTASQVEKAVREGLGVMPSFTASLSETQIKALAAYVSHAAAKP